MCDYSLGGIPNRLGVEGEELVVYRFRTGSIGLTPIDDLKASQPVALPRRSLWDKLWGIFEESLGSEQACAVCIPPGARLTLDRVPVEMQRRWKIAAEEQVVFTQTNADQDRYRDALVFKNGMRLLLQGLQEGMRVRIVSLGSRESEEARELQMRSVR